MRWYVGELRDAGGLRGGVAVELVARALTVDTGVLVFTPNAVKKFRVHRDNVMLQADSILGG